MKWVFDIDPRGTEIISSLSLLVWGVVVYFGSFGMSPAYEYMQQVAPNIVWGTLVAMFGIVQLSCFMFGTQGARCLAALFSCWVFAVLSGFTVDSAWDIPTPYIYGVLALANAWATAQLTT